VSLRQVRATNTKKNRQTSGRAGADGRESASNWFLAGALVGQLAEGTAGQDVPRREHA
jgi:hypothetical protein